MSHFNPSAEAQLKVDASPFGLGTVLLQGSGDDVRPIAYASRTVTDVERRYSQTEREALAIVWACERFHIHLFGQEFKLYTRAYFSVQYCTLCAVLTGKCAVLNAKCAVLKFEMFCLQSTKANGMKTSFEACRQKVLPVLNDYSIAWHG